MDVRLWARCALFELKTGSRRSLLSYAQGRRWKSAAMQQRPAQATCPSVLWTHCALQGCRLDVRCLQRGLAECCLVAAAVTAASVPVSAAVTVTAASVAAKQAVAAAKAGEQEDPDDPLAAVAAKQAVAAASASAAIAAGIAAAAAEAGEQQDDPDPVTAVIVVCADAVASARVIATAVSSS